MATRTTGRGLWGPLTGQAWLVRYDDNVELRAATADEIQESRDAADSDGGAGVITVADDLHSGRTVACYVSEPQER